MVQEEDEKFQAMLAAATASLVDIFKMTKEMFGDPLDISQAAEVWKLTMDKEIDGISKGLDVEVKATNAYSLTPCQTIFMIKEHWNLAGKLQPLTTYLITYCLSANATEIGR
ncbi:hypothetical protein IFR05_007920 [Cadophora sp. M221]|nr:hypothetical protein IFR05_007920 [Cadophora sp. M221]